MTAKDLKNALLQEAVQGHLVPQIAAEGNARDLLEEIKKNHTDLQISTKSAVTKSDLRSKSQIRVTKKELPPITEDEIPFDIPENWCWCRLGEVIELLSGRDLEPSAYNSVSKGIPYMTGASNFENEELIVNRWTDKPVTISNKGDLLITCKGTIGELAFNKVGDVHIARQIMAIRKSNYINLSFLKYFLMCRIDVIQKQAKSMIPGISREVMLNVSFPLPPLAEQKRIVAALEKFMPLIEEYGKKESELNLLNAKIGTLTKKAILQEAVQGRLVPQIAAEGNAKDLLEKIKQNHTDLQISTKSADAKSDLRSKSQIRVTKKELPPVTAEEIPFDIPENWCWCRLGDVCKFLSRGKSPVYSEIRKYPIFAQKCNLKDGEISLEQAQFLDPEVLPKWKEEYKILDGDILVNSTGTGTVMRTRYFKSEYLGNYPFVMPDSHVTVIRTFENIDSKYLYYCCRDFTVQNYWKENLAGSTNQKELYIGVVGNTLIPLPPLAEQKRIVEAIEQLLPLCKKLGQ